MEDHLIQKGTDAPGLPPTTSGALAAWFAEAVNTEITELEKRGKAQAYEVLSGKLIDTRGPGWSVVQFIIADGLRIPEDATGVLKTQRGDYAASVVGQQGTLIDLLLEGRTIPIEGIARAQLVIEDTILLRRLAEVLHDVAKDPAKVSAFSSAIFHTEQATTGSVDLSDSASVASLPSEKQVAIEQACGSSIIRS